MTKEELVQYQDLKKEIASLEKRIEDTKAKEYQMEYDRVSGSNTEFPYQPMTIPIEGIVGTSEKVKKLERLLQIRKDKCETLIIKIEEFICGIPDSRTRRVFEMRYFNGWSWQRIAGNINSGDESYPRKEIHDKYLDKTPKTPN